MRFPSLLSSLLPIPPRPPPVGRVTFRVSSSPLRPPNLSPPSRRCGSPPSPHPPSPSLSRKSSFHFSPFIFHGLLLGNWPALSVRFDSVGAAVGEWIPPVARICRGWYRIPPLVEWIPGDLQFSLLVGEG